MTRDERQLKAILRRMIGREYAHVLQHAALVMDENIKRIADAPERQPKDLAHAKRCAIKMGLLAGATTEVT